MNLNMLLAQPTFGLVTVWKKPPPKPSLGKTVKWLTKKTHKLTKTPPKPLIGFQHNYQHNSLPKIHKHTKNTIYKQNTLKFLKITKFTKMSQKVAKLNIQNGRQL